MPATRSKKRTVTFAEPLVARRRRRSSRPPARPSPARVVEEVEERSNWSDEDYTPQPRISRTREKVSELIKLMPSLKRVGFEDWLRSLQGVAAHAGWYDFEDKHAEGWTPLDFDESVGSKHQRMDAWTIITKRLEIKAANSDAVTLSRTMLLS